MEVTNRFKGLDLIDRVPEDLCTEVHDIVQETGIKTIPKKKKCKKKKKEYSLKNIQVLKNITDNTKLKEIKEKVINKFSV